MVTDGNTMVLWFIH